MMETGTKMLNVPYKGGALALNDLISGQTQIMFPQLPVVMGAAKNGQVRALAVSTLKRATQMPDVPTISEAGLPGFSVGGWNAIYGPRGLPKNVLDILGKATLAPPCRILRCLQGWRTSAFSRLAWPRKKLRLIFNSEFVRWQKIVDGSGLKLRQD